MKVQDVSQIGGCTYIVACKSSQYPERQAGPDKAVLPKTANAVHYSRSGCHSLVEDGSTVIITVSTLSNDCLIM